MQGTCVGSEDPVTRNARMLNAIASQLFPKPSQKHRQDDSLIFLPPPPSPLTTNLGDFSTARWALTHPTSHSVCHHTLKIPFITFDLMGGASKKRNQQQFP